MSKVILVGSVGISVIGLQQALQTFAIASEEVALSFNEMGKSLRSVQPSLLDPKKFILKDAEDEPIGYTYPDPVDSRRTLLKDVNGKTKGYFKRDLLDKRKLIFHQVRERK